ncbi:Uncharacterized protein dnm_025700 [Desulfonema magnum]|uniref:Uncharacterized protein n=1 Tax=Desulfonema magnum TaxID=45655 RepID=A0A975GM52_9BACT|nr:Uncharacterized protein dnm_025700 [Desulfonema magnum]
MTGEGRTLRRNILRESEKMAEKENTSPVRPCSAGAEKFRRIP